MYIHTTDKTVLIFTQLYIVCTNLKSPKITLFSCSCCLGKQDVLLYQSLVHLIYFFNQFFPIYSAFCQYCSVNTADASWEVINIVTSFNSGNVVGPKIQIIYVHCSREYHFFISIFTLVRFIHAARHLDKGVDAGIIHECFKGGGNKEINGFVLSLSLSSL